MKITDSVTLGDARVTDSGYLEANARTARTGVQQYLGSELGRPDLAVVNVYRDEAEVFSKASLETFSRIPITNDHPPEKVTAANWKKWAAGTTGDEVLRDGEFLKIGLKITDGEAVQAVRGGKRELSVGYETTIVWEDGIAPDGTPFQARQTDIVADHIAIVARGRAGAEVRIGDGAAPWGASPILTADERKPDMPDNLRSVMVDGLSVSATDQAAQAIEKLLRDREDARQALAQANTAHTAAIAAKDTELGVKDAEIADLKGKIVDGAALDALVADRSAVVTKAKALAPTLDTAGKSNAEVKRAAVAAKVGDERVAGKSDDYVGALFDHLTVDAKADATPDPVRDAVRDGVNVADADKAVNDARAAMIADMKAGKAA